MHPAPRTKVASGALPKGVMAPDGHLGTALLPNGLWTVWMGPKRVVPAAEEILRRMTRR
jgi:hypothetical protein